MAEEANILIDMLLRCVKEENPRDAQTIWWLLDDFLLPEEMMAHLQDIINTRKSKL